MSCETGRALALGLPAGAGELNIPAQDKGEEGKPVAVLCRPGALSAESRPPPVHWAGCFVCRQHGGACSDGKLGVRPQLCVPSLASLSLAVRPLPVPL